MMKTVYGKVTIDNQKTAAPVPIIKGLRRRGESYGSVTLEKTEGEAKKRPTFFQVFDASYNALSFSERNLAKTAALGAVTIALVDVYRRYHSGRPIGTQEMVMMSVLGVFAFGTLLKGALRVDPSKIPTESGKTEK